MSGTANAEKKQTLRQAKLAERAALSARIVSVWGENIQATAMARPEYVSAEIIGLYAAIQREVPTQAILRDALAAGKEVYLPKIEAGKVISLTRLEQLGALKLGCFNIPEPVGYNRLEPGTARQTLVFVPGVAFDRRGHRLGRGQGWYDRLLELLSPQVLLVGLAYDFQIVEEVPVAAWDRSVQLIITESGVIDCSREG